LSKLLGIDLEIAAHALEFRALYGFMVGQTCPNVKIPSGKDRGLAGNGRVVAGRRYSENQATRR
jgi:hypothetical protein